MTKNFPLEAGLTLSLWDLFASTGPRDMAFSALHEQLPADDPLAVKFRKETASGTMVWLPGGRTGADLAIVSEEDAAGISDVLAVIEVKANASANDSTCANALTFEVLPGEIAGEITAHYFGEDKNPGGYIRQSDMYRSRSWWRETDIRMQDPDQVLWLLFDTRGRTSEVALGGLRPDLWLPVDLKLFAARLREMRPVTPMTDAQQDLVAVVLWHIDQAPGTNVEVSTTIAAPIAVRPSTDEIGEGTFTGPAIS